MTTVLGALLLTAGFLFLPTSGASRDAAISLLTLAWSSAAHVVRAMYKAEDGK
jgi:hypothetical protein